MVLTEKSLRSVKFALVLLLLLSVMLTASFAGASADNDVVIGGETFPDEAFRAYVAANLDKDGNGTLSEAEIAAVQTIDLSSSADCINNTETLEGIGVFTSLRELKAPNMKKLDGVLDLSSNSLLENVELRTNMPAAGATESLDSLVLGNLPNLSRLVVTNRWDLTELDLSGCPALVEANLDGCKLSALDVSHNLNLLSLTCAFTNLADIDLSQNGQLMALSFHHCENMTSLSLAGLSNLHQLSVQYTPIPVLDISGCPYLLALLEDEAYYKDMGDRHLYETNNGNMADRLFFSKTTTLLTGGEILIDETFFPDAAFRQYVSDSFDGNGDGVLSMEEIELVDSIDLANTDCIANTTTLQGIGVFTNLRQLKAPNMKKLDGVLNLASNTLLQNVELRTIMPAAGATESLDGLILGNQPNLMRLVVTNRWDMTALDLSGCPALVDLNLDGCWLSALDLSGNTDLQYLSCAYTKLTALDLSRNRQLELLNFHHNTALGALSLAGLSNLRALSVQGTPISVLDISGCPDLLALLQHPEYYSDMGDSHQYAAGPNYEDDHLWYSKTTTLITGGEIAVDETIFPDAAFRQYVSDTFDGDVDGFLSAEEIESVESIDLSQRQDCIDNTGTLQGIGVFTNLRELKAPNMKKLDGVLSLANNTLLQNVELRTIMPAAGATESLDGLILGNQQSLTDLVLTNRWDLTAVDLGGCPALLNLNLDGCKLSALDLSNNNSLLLLSCAFTDLTELDLSRNRQLLSLNFHHNTELSALSLAGLSNLHQLSVQYTPIPVLDISGCPYLLALLEDEAYYKDMGDRHLYETNNGNMADRLFFSKTTLLQTEAGQVFTTLTLPASLHTIGAGAFEEVAADIVEVPEGCTSIGSRAFANCPQLKLIFIPESASVEDDAFDGSDHVYVSRYTVNVYE